MTAWRGVVFINSGLRPLRQAFLAQQGTHGYKKSCRFTDHKTADSVEGSKRNAFFSGDLENDPDASNARNLFDELTERWDESILFAVIVTVDAGVDTAWKQRVG